MRLTQDDSHFIELTKASIVEKRPQGKQVSQETRQLVFADFWVSDGSQGRTENWMHFS